MTATRPVLVGPLWMADDEVSDITTKQGNVTAQLSGPEWGAEIEAPNSWPRTLRAKPRDRYPLEVFTVECVFASLAAVLAWGLSSYLHRDALPDLGRTCDPSLVTPNHALSEKQALAPCPGLGRVS